MSGSNNKDDRKMTGSRSGRRREESRDELKAKHNKTRRRHAAKLELKAVKNGQDSVFF